MLPIRKSCLHIVTLRKNDKPPFRTQCIPDPISDDCITNDLHPEGNPTHPLDAHEIEKWLNPTQVSRNKNKSQSIWTRFTPFRRYVKASYIFSVSITHCHRTWMVLIWSSVDIEPHGLGPNRGACKAGVSACSRTWSIDSRTLSEFCACHLASDSAWKVDPTRLIQLF